LRRIQGDDVLPAMVEAWSLQAAVARRSVVVNTSEIRTDPAGVGLARKQTTFEDGFWQKLARMTAIWTASVVALGLAATVIRTWIG
jgi:Protein of unknown function (DUF2474)